MCICAQALCKMLAFNPAIMEHTMGLSLLGGDNAALAAQAQKVLVLALAEKAFWGGDLRDIIFVAKQLHEHLPKMSQTSLGELDVNDSEVLSSGWFTQSWVDVHCLRLCGLIMEPKKRYTRELRRECSELVGNKGLLSSRMKALFKTINGSAIQHGKTAFDTLESIYHDDILAMLHAKHGDALAEVVAKGGWQDAYDYVCDMLNDDQKWLRMCAEAFAVAGETELEKKGNTTMRLLHDNILGAVGLVGKHWFSTHASYVDQLFSDAFFGQGLEEMKGELAKATESEPFEPAAITILGWFVDVLGLLQVLSGEAPASCLLGVAVSRARMIICSFYTWRNFASTGDVADAVTQWAETWVLARNSQDIPMEKFEGEVRTVCDLVAKLGNIQRMESLIINFVVEFVGSGNTPAALRVCVHASKLLPAGVTHVLDMIDAFVRLAETAVKVKEGKDAGGVLDLAMQLSAAIKAKEGGSASGLTQRRTSFESDFKLVESEYNVLLKARAEAEASASSAPPAAKKLRTLARE